MATAKLPDQGKIKEIDRIFMENVNRIVPVDLEKEMRKSFIDYAMSVISDRALPDVRDGLKPVHRRILYSMFTQGFTPDKPYRKSATTVGHVLGHYHPHGDAAVYDSMVRLAQDFSMRHSLVDGHGNFGSRDGDPPAAYRYTEARLRKIALELIGEINKNTVDFKPNFDEEEMEPIVLPSRFPNLLVNGSTGIAVGMATNIPPHNLAETIDAVILRMKKPESDLLEILQVLPGPDFPTKGVILGTQGIHECYRTGKGRIVVRANCTIEAMPNNKNRIVVHDLPYMVNKARLIEKIAQLVKEKRLDGISMIRDESDRNEEVRIVIELKRDAKPQVVLNRLYKNTSMQEAFSANILALVPDSKGRFEPRTLTLLQCLDHYIAHQKEVVTRRTEFDLEKTLNRKHIVEGLRLALEHIDEVIRIIRSSSNEDTAKQALCETFGFSDRQAQHIVDMRLGRLTGLERDRLEREYNELVERIAYFRRILEEEELLIATIEEELLETKRKYGDERRTQIDHQADEEIADESLIKREEVVVTLTHFGYIKRMPVDAYQSQHRGGKGITGIQRREEDFVETILTSSTHDYLLFFTDRGRVFRLKGYQIPETGRTSRGMAVINLLELEGDEKVRTVLPISPGETEGAILLATAMGMVKKTRLTEFAHIKRSGIIAIQLRESDQLIAAGHIQPEQDVVLTTENGFSIRFKESDTRCMGRNTIGVKGIHLSGSDRVTSMALVEADRDLLVVSKNGMGKRTSFEEYRLQHRGGKGLRTYRITEKTGTIAGAVPVGPQNDIILITDAGVTIRIDAQEIPYQSRVTQGVYLMRTREGTVVDLAVVEHTEPEEEIPSGERPALETQGEAE